jgi:hypothetical protein
MIRRFGSSVKKQRGAGRSPNEFFRLSSFEKGKQAFAMLLSRLAQ